jgi:dTDP-4-dehydrorhamnose 3,5-epimerase
VTKGEVYDVAVDLRKGSPTYGKYVGAVLTAEKKNQFFIPRGFAHGFLVLSDEAEFVYKCDEFYHPEDEGGIRWDDPSIGIAWPDVGPRYYLSQKDNSFPRFDSDVL